MSNNNGQRLAGKTAVITGGATGIGLASEEGSVNSVPRTFRHGSGPHPAGLRSL